MPSSRLFFFLLSAILFALPSQVLSETTGDICPQPALSKALAQYRQLAERGGWPQVPAGPSLREGDRDARVPILRERLVAEGDLNTTSGREDRFDEALKEAVQRFQARHGLLADGVAGSKTLAELNLTLADRIKQLEINMKRCQPLPERLERRHLLVNIADFRLSVYEDGKPVLNMPVIVGKSYRQTPVLNGRISSLVLNPTWEVPHSIATQDLLPKIRKNSGYLKKLHIKVLRGWSPGTEIAPESVSWDGLSPARFPFRLRQEPGPDNALGRIKFIFPNPHDIYLHDTPARELFRQDDRAFSSGCIRLARPLELAAYLLKDSPLSEPERLAQELATGKTKAMPIPEPIAIHIVYLTAWVDQDGIVQFRRDVYQRD